jgi:hypothetical protein
MLKHKQLEDGLIENREWHSLPIPDNQLKSFEKNMRLYPKQFTIFYFIKPRLLGRWKGLDIGHVLRNGTETIGGRGLNSGNA